ncbi:MAG: ATP synthase F0 subunit B [Patescibacteria group bacterium]|nr:ATP synthase F0 subunit B [Patescibacteria group bacterium]
MAQILATFGVDWRLVLVNSINFGIALLALWYFLYAPLMRVLEERRARVARGVADAQAAAERLAQTEVARQKVLAEAGQEADAALGAARKAAAALHQEAQKASSAAARGTLRDARARAQEIEAQALEHAKRASAKLIVLGVGQMLTTKRGRRRTRT